MIQRKLKVRLQIQDTVIRQEFTRVISTIEGFEIYSSGDAGIADLLILQLGDQPEEGIRQAHQAIQSGIVGQVFLTSKIIKQEILIEAMRAGVKEFFSQPLKTEDVKMALARIKEQHPKGAANSEAVKKQGVIINIIGTKGGIGTTTVAVNLATSIAGLDRGKSVALIDMNLLFGEILMFLGIDSIFDWVEVAKNVYRIDSTYLMDVMSLDRSGVRVLPSPARVMDEVRVTPTVVEALLMQMKSMFDYIVIDSGQSLDEISKTTMRLSDSQLVVTLLSLPCLVNVKRLQDAFHKFGYPLDENVKILVNRFQKRSVISLEDAEGSLKKKVFWAIPNDFQTTMTAINQGKPLADVEPQAEITDSFRELAALVAGRSAKKKSILTWK
jgi:pilus assembly protein CpaE